MKKTTEEIYALQLDNQDPLADYRERFVIDDPNWMDSAYYIINRNRIS